MIKLILRGPYAETPEIHPLTDATPPGSLVQRVAKMAEIPNLHERTSENIAEIEVPHQPNFKMFRSSYDPRLEIQHLTDDVLECAWEPGNATRYEMVLTRTHRGVMATWLSKDGVGGRSFILIGSGVGYIMEKWGYKNDHDVRPMLDLLTLLGYAKEGDWY